MVLEARGLKKAFRSKTGRVEAVRGVSLTLDAGEVLAFLGPNGAGKTTSIKMIAGLVQPDAGDISIMGLNPHRDPWALREVGAVLEGNRNIYWRLTPQENLEYFGTLRGLKHQAARERGKELLARFDLAYKSHEPVSKLSRGMQQKLAIAVALVHKPKLLLLDEPTLGLDVEAAIAVKELVREIAEEGHAVLLTTHQLDVAQELSGQVAIIRQGQIITKESTRELIERFSGNHYSIAVDGGLNPKQLERLSQLGATVTDQQITYLGNTDGLWNVLETIRPLPLLSVEKDQADLTEVFLKLINNQTEPNKEVQHA